MPSRQAAACVERCFGESQLCFTCIQSQDAFIQLTAQESEMGIDRGNVSAGTEAGESRNPWLKSVANQGATTFIVFISLSVIISLLLYILIVYAHYDFSPFVNLSDVIILVVFIFLGSIAISSVLKICHSTQSISDLCKQNGNRSKCGQIDSSADPEPGTSRVKDLKLLCDCWPVIESEQTYLGSLLTCCISTIGMMLILSCKIQKICLGYTQVNQNCLLTISAIVVFVSAVAGGCVFLLRLLYLLLEDNRWDWWWHGWRIWTPWVSGTISVAFYGLLLTTKLSTLQLKTYELELNYNNLAYYLIVVICHGFIFGYFSDKALGKLKDLADSIFGIRPDEAYKRERAVVERHLVNQYQSVQLQQDLDSANREAAGISSQEASAEIRTVVSEIVEMIRNVSSTTRMDQIVLDLMNTVENILDAPIKEPTKEPRTAMLDQARLEKEKFQQTLETEKDNTDPKTLGE
jgi:hypothetical protein